MSTAKSKTRSPEAVAKVARLFNAILASPRIKRFEERWDQALKGDREALLEVIDDSGIEVLDDEGIKEQIYSLDPAQPADRQVLKQIVRRMSKYLLKVRPRGRPPRTPAEAKKLRADVQRAFDTSPVRMKARYNASRVRQRDIRLISEHVARAVQSDRRGSILLAAQKILRAKPGIGNGFGYDVVAESLSCSPRGLRSTKKRKRL